MILRGMKLFTQAKCIHAVGTNLDEIHFTGFVIVQYKCAIRHLPGIPCIVRHFWITQCFEKTISFSAEKWYCKFAFEFFSNLDIIPIGIKINILVFVKDSAATL